ncbi:hypothetical protein GCM10009865_06230 [Aeromicrobium ponti]|uniref:Uncharacterized protein n=1 Tax=Cytobacillus oceanisediminis TaxID=665099 RepID=A0A562K767_9BACI|nr:hypothetical protein IQ19_00524 [Cytobacillus oceanisediminis]
MAKKGIQNSSIEQVQIDHETESAFQVDNPKKGRQTKVNNDINFIKKKRRKVPLFLPVLFILRTAPL